MGRNLEKDAIEMADKNRRILENGFRIFSERTIEKVKMAEVAEAAGIGIASLYRYYSTKPALVLGISTWLWDKYLNTIIKEKHESERFKNMTGAEAFEDYLDSFLDMYRNHADMLRFNQFFNVYLQSEDIPAEDMKPYEEAVGELEKRFETAYRKGIEDGTLRSDIPMTEIFSSTAHLMLAAVTRYAVGLAYTQNTDAEKELELLKSMLLKEYATAG